MLRWMGFIAALALLSSCSILPAETFEVYQLPPSSIAIATAPDRLPLTLHIAKADSSRLTDSQRVLILNQNNRVSAYKKVRWSDPPPSCCASRSQAPFAPMEGSAWWAKIIPLWRETSSSAATWMLSMSNTQLACLSQ